MSFLENYEIQFICLYALSLQIFTISNIVRTVCLPTIWKVRNINFQFNQALLIPGGWTEVKPRCEGRGHLKVVNDELSLSVVKADARKTQK